MRDPNQSEMNGAIAYVLKGYPRLSEIFIASEIYRLEQMGLSLCLIVIKPPDEDKHHDVVKRIKARPHYLPPTTTLSSVALYRWLWLNLPNFLPGLARVLFRRPGGITKAAFSACAQSVRARRSTWSLPRKVYVKELLQATAVADRLLREPKIRHLHAHFCHGATTVAWLASQITGLPFSFTAHAKDIYSDELNPAGLLRRKMNAAKFVVTCTQANRRHLQGLTTTKVHCIYHGLNADFTRLLQEETDPPTRNGLRLLGVGRLVPKKGFDVLVDACDILRKRGVAFETVIVGQSGEHESEVRRRIKQHRLESVVHLRGALTQADLLREYRRATALCLPCRIADNGDRDGLPNVLMEAMASGLPLITTNTSGIPELIDDNFNGLLVPADDPQALAQAVLRLRGNVALAHNLAVNARQTVLDRFNGEQFVTRLASLFREAMG